MVNANPIEMDEEEFEKYLNDCYPDVVICGITMSQGTILKECDFIAFRCALADQEPVKWECDECGAEYDNEDLANECCDPDYE